MMSHSGHTSIHVILALRYTNKTGMIRYLWLLYVWFFVTGIFSASLDISAQILTRRTYEAKAGPWLVISKYKRHHVNTPRTVARSPTLYTLWLLAYACQGQ